MAATIESGEFADRAIGFRGGAMRQDQAKRKILKVWRNWGTPEQRAHPIAPLMFYTDLCARRPELLEFRCKGDPYHLVAGWITGENRPRLVA